MTENRKSSIHVIQLVVVMCAIAWDCQRGRECICKIEGGRGPQDICKIEVRGYPQDICKIEEGRERGYPQGICKIEERGYPPQDILESETQDSVDQDSVSILSLHFTSLVTLIIRSTILTIEQDLVHAQEQENNGMVTV